jgi:hypothetical protein
VVICNRFNPAIFFLPVPTFLSHDLFVFIDLKREVVVRLVDDDGGIFVQATFS